MKPIFLFRLVLDFVAVSLLLTAMAYYAFDNATHEVAGTAMFLLLIAHNIFNRRWYGTITKGRREARSLTTKAINLSLLVAMVTLLATSVVISQTVFSFLSLTSTFTIRQVHTLVAYLTLMIVGLHLGLHWAMLMGMVRTHLGSRAGSKYRTFPLRAAAVAMALFGVYCSFERDLASKLTMKQSFGFGELEVPLHVFIMQSIGILSLSAILVYYTLQMMKGQRQANRRADG